MVDRIKIAPAYTISRIIKGGWQLAGGHGPIDEAQAIQDMFAYVEAGITTFDCADIYTGVENLIGKFLQQYRTAWSGAGVPIQIHTKYVPDHGQLAAIKRSDTEAIIDRSLRRLQVEQLDLVQFAWWDYRIPTYLDVAEHLVRLQEKGKIRHLGITNFDSSRTEELLRAGMPIVTAQAQYSLLDQRPADRLVQLCREQDVQLLSYGVLAGGFLREQYVGATKPAQPLENRSLTKYYLIIEEFGGWDLFQELLKEVDAIAKEHSVGIAEIAMRFVLDLPQVAGIIVGARHRRHLSALAKLSPLHLGTEDRSALRQILAKARGPGGPVYGLEREKDGPHGRIMRYNLNSKGSA